MLEALRAHDVHELGGRRGAMVVQSDGLSASLSGLGSLRRDQVAVLMDGALNALAGTAP